ncbi:phage tail assembly chaperone [Pseudomonas sp. NY15354]|uniref:phage tail assembly chaperone n=1 Tax=Pseudomonas sp. NY15354 TaxID=3400351 RepID=UPI003A83FAFC
MQRFYSRTTGCTYLEGINAKMPADAVRISEERFMAVIGNPPLDKVRGHDADGLPVLIDPPPPSPADLAEDERRWRDSALSPLVWLRDRHRDQLEIGAATTLTPEQFAELLGYMQQLRDWPQSEAFPDSAQRPVAPPWIADQAQ